MTPPSRTELFHSFWQAGYAGATPAGAIADSAALPSPDFSQHNLRAAEDYALLAEFGIRTVREKADWRAIEADGIFNFASLEVRAAAAENAGIQIVWSLSDRAWPDGLAPDSPAFADRFAAYCAAVAGYLNEFSSAAPVYSLIDDISLIARTSPEHAIPAVKRQLIGAALAGGRAVRAVVPHARLLHCDRVQGRDAGAESCFETWDMLTGRSEPELGGSPDCVDVIGINFYGDCGPAACPPDRLSLHQLLVEAHRRYECAVMVSETSHVGNARGAWIREVAHNVAMAACDGIDVVGVCVHPVLDRPDWDEDGYLHYSGLWDVRRYGDDGFRRVLSEPYAAALRQAQRITGHFCPTYAPSTRQGDRMPAIIVFSHLRWDFVLQRPQHLLTRLAEYYPVVFVEEPIYDENESGIRTYTPAPNVLVCQPLTSVAMPGFHDDQLPQLRKLMRQLVADYDDHIVWFYTPMALPLLQEFHPRLVVYDCMDELASFKNAPKQLLQRESGVLKVADIVFTGGPSLYEAKKERHPNVHCFPSSVDVVHFEQALDRTNSHPAHKDIPGPRLGFYGVIDERFDAELVGKLADAHPQWQIVLVGPIVKVDPASLPQRPNIHYLGQQPYAALPQFLAGWDVCLLPFALNESTRFISPTKTLEYMAAELPIVSTPVTDVVNLYGEVVYVAKDAGEFIAACEAALLETVEQRLEKIDQMRAIVARTSWDSTAERMHLLMNETPSGRKLPVKAPETVESNSTVNPLRKSTAVPNVKCVIVGAGPTGLSAAYHLDKDTLVLDKNATVGGWCRSIEDKGFTFDYAGHIMFSNDPYVLKLYQILLGDNLHWQNREAWVYSKGVHTRYPFQGALYGLPPTVIKECIVGAMEARFGAVKKPDTQCDAANKEDVPVTREISDCCADGTVTLPAQTTASAQAVSLGKPVPGNFEEFIYKMWGSGIAKHFAIPYNRKLWTVPLTEMETSWLGGRVPLPNLEEIIEGALEPVGKPMGPNARFGYPLKGGFQALMNGFLPHIKGQIEMNADVVQLSPSERIVALADGRRFHYDSLISTMPLPDLIRLIGDEAPQEIRDAANGLKHISIRCVNLGVARENLTEKHWIYYPEDSIFHRIFVQGNASPDCNPPGGFGITCEISYSPWKPLPLDGQRLIDRCVADCIKVGLMTPEDKLITANQVDMPYAYVVYDHARAKNVETVKAWLTEHDIVLSGRYSEWEYYNSDHAFLAGKKAAETVKWMQPKKSAVVD